jgi:hypothetical protein
VRSPQAIRAFFLARATGRLLLPPSGEEASEPLPPAIRLEPAPPQRGPGSLDEELPPIDSSAVADVPPPRLATRGGWPWHSPQPRGKLPAMLKRVRLTDGGDQGRGCQRPHPRARLQALAPRMRGPARLELRGGIRQPFLQHPKFRRELPKERLAQGGALGPFRLPGGHAGVAALRPTRWEDSALHSS